MYVAHLLSLATLVLMSRIEQHDPDDEPVAPPLDPEFFEFDRTSPIVVCRSCTFSDGPFSITVHKDDISREQLKELLYEEIMSFNPVVMTS